MARAGTQTTYYWGDKIGKGHAICDGCGAAIDDDPAPAATVSPNPWGLYDMLGSLWEWTEDCSDYPYSKIPRDGSPLTDKKIGDCDEKVIRGGAYMSQPRSLRAAYRKWYEPDERSHKVGFRLVTVIGK